MVRLVGRAMRACATALVFVAATAAGALLHTGSPAVRRAVVHQVDAALASAFAGHVTIERVATLGATGAAGVDAKVEDPQGRTVLALEGVRARVSTFGTLVSLVRGGAIAVDIPEIVVARADVDLDADESGTPRIARAFAPRSPPSGEPSRGVRVVLASIHVDHLSIHGKPGAAPTIDAGVDGLAGSLRVAPGSFEAEITSATVSSLTLPGGAKAAGTLAGNVAMPSPRGRPLGLHASWKGVVGAVAESATAALDGEDLDATLEGSAVAPDAVRTLWPACPFTEATSVHAETHGALPRLALRADAGLGSGKVEVTGNVTLGAGVSLAAHVAARSIDARALAAQAPVSDLAATADVSLAVSGAGASSGEATVDFAGGTVAGVAVPAATAHGMGAFDPNDPDAARASATVNVRETGAPASFTLHYAPKGATNPFTFEGRAVVPRLDEAPRLGRVARGQAAAAFEGGFDPAAGRFEAEAQVTASEVRIDGAWVHDATLVARASGPVGAPRFDASLDGGEVDIGPLHFASLHAHSRGTAAGAPVQVWLRGRTTEVRARANAALLPKPSLSDLVVTLEKDGERAEARAAFVSAGGGETRVDDAEIDGFGAPVHATLRQSPGALYVRAHSQHLDLARIGALLGVKGASGRVAVDLDTLLHANGAQGRVQVDVHDATFDELTGVQAHLAATLDGRRVSGVATATVADIGSFDIHSTSLAIGGSDAPSWSYWKRAWGAADATAHIDLAKLAAGLPPGSLPFDSQTGVVDLSAHVERDSVADATPGVDVVAHTTGLVIGGSSARGPWRLEGVDATAHVKVDGNTGHTAVDAALADSGGSLATLTATSDGVPYAAFFAGEDTLDAVRTMPFQAEVALPSRDVQTLPAALGIRSEKGLLEADVRYGGTLAQPVVDVTASLKKGRADVRLLALPIELDLKGHYDGAHADASLQATTRGRRVLETRAGIDVRAADLLQWTRGAPLPWKASSRTKLAGFPLQSVGALDDRGVRGKVSGDLALDDFHDDARATLSVAIDGLKVGDIAYKDAKLTASVDGKGADAGLRIDQDDGFAEAHAKVGTRWGAAWAPSIDASRPVDLSLAARQYRLGLLAPFLSSFVSEVDGHLTADLHVQVDPATQTVRPQGTASLQDGTFELAALGGGFHDVTAQVTLTPDGVVRLENVSARGMSGRLEAAATARVDGRGLSGLRGQIQVPQKEQLPVVFDDVQVGTFYGALSVDVDRAPDGRKVGVNVGVQSLHVTLPLAAGHDVQTLGSIDGLQMSRRSAARAAAASGAASKTSAPTGTPVEVTIDLGKDAEVKRGTTLDIVLEGRPTLSIAENIRAGGQIRLPRGSIDVQGKVFTVENGTVTFVGDDPTNPQVALTAKWPAPEGTVVYADFIGPLKTGQVSLRSEPARSKNEIIALLLFGTVDDAASASANGSGAQGLSVVGGAAGSAATQPINRVLDSFGLAGGVSTKIDTSSTTPRPEVEVQIARDISLQVAWVLGVPPPGSNPDQTLLTLNWRFLRKWSLATTVGDAGTSIVDLIWQHRY